jgi:hypothetical protein
MDGRALRAVLTRRGGDGQVGIILGEAAVLRLAGVNMR